LLISGASADMNAWESSTLGNLSSNQTVIVFDNRGVGNTITTGTKPFSIQQFANDTAGLLDALKLQKADVLRYSLGATVAQQLTVTHPDKVNRLILVGASCGGKESIPPSPQLVEFMSDIVNKSLNNIPVTEEEVKEILSSSLGSAWVKLHHNSLENIPTTEDVVSTISPNTMKQQFRIGQDWIMVFVMSLQKYSVLL
jgi:pimeloyl-ACP methyl ester carboxylesterase